MCGHHLFQDVAVILGGSREVPVIRDGLSELFAGGIISILYDLSGGLLGHPLGLVNPVSQELTDILQVIITQDLGLQLLDELLSLIPGPLPLSDFLLEFFFQFLDGAFRCVEFRVGVEPPVSAPMIK